MLKNASDFLSQRDLTRIGQFAPGADAAGFLHPVQQAIIHRRGWLRMLAPAAAGGAEMPLPAVVRLEEAIAAADASMGWVVTLCAGAGWFAGFLPPALAREVVGTRRLCVAGSGAPTGFADADGDGYRLSGLWAIATGAPMATHFTLNAVVREHGQPVLDDGAARIRAFIVPAREVDIVPTWGSIGMRATASHSYRIDNRRVAADHAFVIDAARATACGPLYRFPFLSLAFVTLAANVAGIGAHFLQLAQVSIGQRRHPVSGVPLAESPEVARRLHSATAQMAAARAHFYRLLDDAWEQVAAGAALPAHECEPLHAASLALVEAARRGVDELYPCCGLRAAHQDSEINRVWRDLHTATQHALLLP